jgi:hypothetical protein
MKRELIKIDNSGDIIDLSNHSDALFMVIQLILQLLEYVTIVKLLMYWVFQYI